MRAGAAQCSVDGRYGTVLRLRRRVVAQRYARSRSTYKPVPRAMCRPQARRARGRTRSGMQLCGTWSVTCGAILPAAAAGTGPGAGGAAA